MGIWNLPMRAEYNSIFLAKLEQFNLGQIPMLYASVFVYIYTAIILFKKNNFFMFSRNLPRSKNYTS